MKACFTGKVFSNEQCVIFHLKTCLSGWWMSAGWLVVPQTEAETSSFLFLKCIEIHRSRPKHILKIQTRHGVPPLIWTSRKPFFILTFLFQIFAEISLMLFCGLPQKVLYFVTLMYFLCFHHGEHLNCLVTEMCFYKLTLAPMLEFKSEVLLPWEIKKCYS